MIPVLLTKEELATLIDDARIRMMDATARLVREWGDTFGANWLDAKDKVARYGELRLLHRTMEDSPQ